MSMPVVTITGPNGVTVSPGRETTMLGPNNTNVQGMSFTLSNATIGSTSIFVPYSLMSDTAAVAQLFADRVAQITAIAQLGS
jgi:hypothetical protein